MNKDITWRRFTDIYIYIPFDPTGYLRSLSCTTLRSRGFQKEPGIVVQLVTNGSFSHQLKCLEIYFVWRPQLINIHAERVTYSTAYLYPRAKLESRPFPASTLIERHGRAYWAGNHDGNGQKWTDFGRDFGRQWLRIGWQYRQFIRRQH